MAGLLLGSGPRLISLNDKHRYTPSPVVSSRGWARQVSAARLSPERESVITPRTLEIAVHHPAYQMDLDVTKVPPDTH